MSKRLGLILILQLMLGCGMIGAVLGRKMGVSWLMIWVFSWGVFCVLLSFLITLFCIGEEETIKKEHPIVRICEENKRRE